MSFISSLVIDTPSSSNNITLNLPMPIVEEGKHTISVIAGKNRSGKSHILHHINQCLVKLDSNYKNTKQVLKNVKESNVSINMSDDGEIPKFEITKDINTIIKMAASISYQQRAKQKYSFLNEYRMGLFGLTADIIKTSPLLNRNFDSNKYLEDENYRLETIKKIEQSSGELYECSDDVPMIKLLERAFSTRILIGAPRHISDQRTINEHVLMLYMYFGENSCYPYESWSSGQKSFFVYLLLASHLQISKSTI